MFPTREDAKENSGDAGDTTSRHESWGWLLGLGVTTSVGLVILAFANNLAWSESPWSPRLYWLSLGVMAFPVALRLSGASASRKERVGLLVMLTLALYLVKLFASPLGFTLHDELGHWRTADDIVQTGHFFHDNWIVKYYPSYPGLEAVTSALVTLGGLTIFQAGVIIIGLARLLFVGALFLFFEQVSRSSRVAGLATLFYAANPNFVYFTAQYAHESLALPLAAFCLLMLARRKNTASDRRTPYAVGFALVFLALVVTHHITPLAFTGFLVLWGVTARLAWWAQRERADEGHPWLVAVFTLDVVLAWLIYVRYTVVTSLGPILSDVVTQFLNLVTGAAESKTLFQSGTGEVQPLLERLLGFGSVGLLLLALPFGLWAVWRYYRHRGEALALAGVALVYPLSLALRLTQAGTETSNRASEFVFLGLAFVVAVFFVRVWPLGFAWRRPLRRWLGPALMVAYFGVVFTGGIIVGWPPYARTVGPFLLSADSRSVTEQGVSAALWARGHLEPYNFVLADTTNGLLMGSYGRQNPQAGSVNGTSVWNVFFSDSLGDAERTVLQTNKVRYVVVDERLSQSLPYNGRYFGREEPGANRHREPLDEAALAKFDSVAEADRVYDSGNIVIYDFQRLLEAERR